MHSLRAAQVNQRCRVVDPLEQPGSPGVSLESFCVIGLANEIHRQMSLFRSS